MSLIHEDDVNWFLTTDETLHLFSTVGTKSGATAGRYTNPSFPRSGEQCIESSFHTTGVNGTTLQGQPLPPMPLLGHLMVRMSWRRIGLLSVYGTRA